MNELFHIISDGSCDLPKDLAEEKNITVVPFYVSFDEKRYERENIDISIRDFYQKMVDYPKIYPKSSMPSVQDYMDAFLPYAQKNVPVVCICITTKFSGSMQSALNAKEMVLEEYPEAQIEVMDSTINTVLQGLFVLEAVRLRDGGASFADAIKRLEEIKGTGRIFFTVGDLEYLKHGGRIGKVAGIAGSILGIRPVITLKQGEIFPSGIGRSRKATIGKCIDLLLNYLKESKVGIECYSISIGYGYGYEEAQELKEKALCALKDNGFLLEDLPLFQIGATIGVHTGPFPIGFGIIEKSI